MFVLRRSKSQSRLLVVALAAGILTLVGCAGGNSSSGGSNATAMPTFSPGAGTYNASQTVTIATTTPGAVLYCTTDGTTPTTSSPQCSQPTTVFKTEFLQALAVAPGLVPSAIASAGYTINLNGTPTPTFSPAGGSYATAQNVTISDTAKGANIYYTLDGTVPTVNATLYTGPVAISKSATLSAIAAASGFANSGVQSASYVIGQGIATPVISPAGGTFNAATPVTITDATPGAVIYYTVDGSTPSSSSTPYLGLISVSANETINAIAVTSNGSSAVATASFSITIPAASSPTFNPGAGTYSSTQTVLLSDSTPGATIYYTVDGSNPTTGSTPYTGSGISVTASETIKAIATAPGFAVSAVSSAAYTINVTVAPPTFSPAGGTYSSVQQVVLSDTTPGAVIYYTTDGSPATTSSSQYRSGSPIAVSATETINAIAAAGSDLSTMATAAYTINLGPSYSGKVMSGTMPVNGSTVQMYAAGQGGYGSSATVLSTTSATTGADGSFTLNYNCPAAPGDLIYLVATGGSTASGGSSNPSLVFMAALGACNGTLPASVVVNEVTTVASVYSLSQFMTGVASVGSSAANYEKGTNTSPGLSNAFGTVKNLVDLTTGQTRDHTPDYPTNLAGDPNILNNSTVPQARINTLANVLNACAGSGSGCSSLFSASTPSSGTAPTDTLLAILNIAQNPANNAGAVYNVTAGNGPFTPALPAAPNDWTLALTFTGSGLGFAPGVPVTFAPPHASNGAGQILNSAMAIDATGNIWVTGYNYDSNLGVEDLASGMIAAFSNSGAPLKPASSMSSGQTSYGGYIPLSGFSTNAGTLSSHGISFDTSGNAWIIGGDGAAPGNTQSPGVMTEISPGFSVVSPDILLGFRYASPVAIDGLNNIWTFGSDSSGTPVIERLNPSGNVLTNNGLNQGGNQVGYFNMQSLIFDSNASALWSSDPSALTVYQINPGDGSNTSDYFNNGNGNGYTPLVAGPANPDGSAGNVYGCEEPGGQILDVFNVSSTSILTSYPLNATGRGCGGQMVMDGAGHIFTITGNTSATATPGIIDEYSISGSGLTLLTPASTGYTGTSSAESPTINPDPNVPLNSATGAVSTQGVAGAAIDGSGNLWVLNADTGTTSSQGNVLVEFVGIAAPVVTPTSLAIQFGQVGVRP